MEIVDAQIHELPVPGRALGCDPGVRTLVCVENTREALDSVGVDAALVVARQQFLDGCVSAYPERFAGVMVLDPARPDLEELIRTYRDRPGMLAARVQVAQATTAELRPEFAAGHYDAAIGWAEESGLPLFFSTHGWTRLLVALADRHPGLTMVVDHLGLVQSPPSAPPTDPWQALGDLLELARFPNVYVKLGGLPLLSAQPYPYPAVWPNLHRVIGAFLPQRLMWASDFTRMRLAPQTLAPAPRDCWSATYSECLNFLLDTSELSTAEKQDILGLTVRRALRWDRPSPGDQEQGNEKARPQETEIRA